MKLPKNILQNNYERPDIYLCGTNKEKICKLDPIEYSGSFKFNSYSEINFTISRYVTNVNTGKNFVNPYYDKIDGLMNIFVENFGYFEIQTPKIIFDGIKETKEITAYSLEYVLSQKNITNLKINTGDPDSLEVILSTDDHISPIVLYNKTNTKLSLLHLILENVFGWKIGIVDEQLASLSRSFDIQQTTVYDFLINDVCDKFNCFINFDTTNNLINVFSEEKQIKFFGNNVDKIFNINPPFPSISTVSINGYKTVDWTYDNISGDLTLSKAPALGDKIEVFDSSMDEYKTDIFISFENLSKEVTVDYNIEDIKTKLNVTYGNNIDIREANLGNDYLLDLSYYHTKEWMGENLFNDYNLYIQKVESSKKEYENNSKIILEYANKIDFEMNRLSLGYSIASVDKNTIGDYYIRGGESPNYYYNKVSLPEDYKVNTTYYSLKTTNLTEKKVRDLYKTLKLYFNKNGNWESEMLKLDNDFQFVEKYTLNQLISDLKNTDILSEQDKFIERFLLQLWDEIGLNPLYKIYYESYKTIQTTNVSDGWSSVDNSNYWSYYPVTLYLSSIDKSKKEKEIIVDNYKLEYEKYMKLNSEISSSLILQNNFTEKELIKLNNFIREDSINFDDIVETKTDSTLDTFKNKEHAIASGKIELNKISQPRLSFSMSLKNIYALPEFEKFIDQFQLGNIITIYLRSDYIKRSRILEINIDFNDFSSFSCNFGELMNVKSIADIHADLMSQAISAGKSVAKKSDIWTQGSNQSNQIQENINKGFLDAITSIKSIDGTQGVEIDKYGIHLNKIDPITGEKDLKQGWITNNKFLYTDDGFKSTKSVFGEFTYDNVEYYGILAEAVIGGIIVGSKISGGTINIGNRTDGKYNFEVNSNGDVFMRSKNVSIEGYTTDEDLGKISLKVNNLERDTNSKFEITYNKISAKVDSVNSAKSFGWNLTDSSWNVNGNNVPIFTVNANGGYLKGEIVANSGMIGNWNISVDGGRLVGTTDNTDGTTNVISLSPGKSNLFNDVVISVGTVGIDFPFQVKKNGEFWATNAHIKGDISADSGYFKGELLATAGTIGGWQIKENYLYSEEFFENNGYRSVGLFSTGINSIVVQYKDGEYPYKETMFKVTSKGKMYSTDAVISGDVNAKSGKIGALRIQELLPKEKRGGYIGIESDGYSTYIGPPNLSLFSKYIIIAGKKDGDADSEENYPFKLEANGILHAVGANISGTINASTGVIGGWKITNNGEGNYDDQSFTKTGIETEANYVSFTGIYANYTDSNAYRIAIGKQYDDGSRSFNFTVNKWGYLVCSGASLGSTTINGSTTMNDTVTVNGSIKTSAWKIEGYYLTGLSSGLLIGNRTVTYNGASAGWDKIIAAANKA